LTDSDDDGVWTGSTGDLRMGSYNMSIEIVTTDDIVEIVDTGLGITYEDSTPSNISLDAITTFGILSVAAVVLVVIVVILKKKG
jgi:hypothetical protein